MRPLASPCHAALAGGWIREPGKVLKRWSPTSAVPFSAWVSFPFFLIRLKMNLLPESLGELDLRRGGTLDPRGGKMSDI